MALDDKQVYDLNNMNAAAQRAKLGDLVKSMESGGGGGSGYVLPAAKPDTLGGVKQATAIEDSSGATDTALETKFNALLAALRTAGILANS